MSREVLTFDADPTKIRLTLEEQVDLQNDALHNYRPVLLPSKYRPKQIVNHCMEVETISRFVESLRSGSFHSPEESEIFEIAAGGIVSELLTEELIRAGWYDNELDIGQKTTVLSNQFVTPIIAAFYAPHAEVITHVEAFGIKATQIKVGDRFVTNPDILVVDSTCRENQLKIGIETSISDRRNYWRFKRKRHEEFKQDFTEYEGVSSMVEELTGVYCMQEYAYQKKDRLLGKGNSRIVLPLPYNRNELTNKVSDLMAQPPKPKPRIPTKRQTYKRERRQHKDYLREFIRI